MQVDSSILMFDGVCNLCNSAVQKVIKWDKKDRIKFSSLQSQFSQSLLLEKGMDPRYLDSLVLVNKGQVFVKSEAFFELISIMGGWVRILSVFRIFPLKIRDWVYDIVARNRYKWFGQKDHCMIPDKRLKGKFIE